MKFSETIKKLRENRGMSKTTLAELTNSSPSYISRVEKGEFENPTKDTLEKFSVALEVNSSVFFNEKLENSSVKDALIGLKEIPLLSGTVSAGAFTRSFDDWSGEYMALPVKSPKSKVAWRISGRSMEPEYQDGDIAIIDHGIQWLDGDHVIAETPDGVCIKVFKKTRDGQLELRPLNPEFPTMWFNDGDHVQILGVVVQAVKNVRKRR